MSASCVIGLLCLLFYVSIWYEIFVRSHQILSPALLVGLWFHIPRGKNLSTLLLGVVSLVWAISKLCQLVTMIWTSSTTVTVQESLVGLQLLVARPQRFLHGQSINLKIPQIQMFGYHPFLVVPTKKQRELRILAIPLNGSARHLSNIGARVPAFFDGPFGSPINLRPYGIVVMVATGEGFINLIPYVHAILDDHQHYRNTTRQIDVHWTPEYPVVHNMMGPEMDKLLALDFEGGSGRDRLPSEQTRGNQIKQYLLDIFVYGADRDYDEFSGRNRLHIRRGGPNLNKILGERVGKTCKVAYLGKQSN